jgi:hypothetical protein
MPLPPVPGWLVDYATARDIFTSGSNPLKAKIRAMCAAGTLKFCACEKKSFRGSLFVRGPFYEDQNCSCNLTQEIVEIASELPDVVLGKKMSPSDNSARMIVACAIRHNYGLVSSKSGFYLSPIELGTHQGVTCLSLVQFSALA